MFDGWTFGMVDDGVFLIPWIEGLEWVFPLLVVLSIALLVRFLLSLIPVI